MTVLLLYLDRKCTKSGYGQHNGTSNMQQSWIMWFDSFTHIFLAHTKRPKFGSQWQGGKIPPTWSCFELYTQCCEFSLHNLVSCACTVYYIYTLYTALNRQNVNC